MIHSSLRRTLVCLKEICLTFAIFLIDVANDVIKQGEMVCRKKGKWRYVVECLVVYFQGLS